MGRRKSGAIVQGKIRVLVLFVSVRFSVPILCDVCILKTWMCGGRLEFVPCSRVGHIFRSGHPYNMTGESGQHLSSADRNSIRLAQVWLDEYKEVFYMYKQHLATVNFTVSLIR